ncbi:3-deoxy-D-manno-octulosonic acid transferase [Serratia symbiotica]|nr:3-deoxy-D-manno-octulosonic acid transferase [Serratia symbiotica]
MSLYFYKILLYIIQPIILLKLLLRSRLVPDYRKRLKERYGFYNKKNISSSIILHAVSVGETLTAIPLVKALRKYYPYLSITITTMTPTGSERVKHILGNDVYHVYLPYDLPCSINRFLKKINPKLVIIMETELWPNLIYELHKRNIPLIIINARLSERSSKKYKIINTFIKKVLHRITLIVAQNKEDGMRFIKLGLHPSKLNIIGNLKFNITITQKLSLNIISLRYKWKQNRPIWIAASTHHGEENILLTAQRQLLKKYPNLLLILVPRHQERFIIVKKLVHKYGFNYILRSDNKAPNNNTQIIIGDTIGELMLLYGISDIAFIGGSLVKNGGHNPLEAAIHTIPILMGPYTFNFKDICKTLLQNKGLITITNVNSLINKIDILLTNKNYRDYYGRHAFKVLQKNKRVLQQLLTILQPYLPTRGN